MNKKVLGLALSSLIAAGAASAGEEDLVKYRMNVMEILGGHMGNIAAIMKREVPYSDNLAYHAKGLADAAPLILPTFETKAMGDHSHALPAIWDDWAEFEKHAKSLEESSARLSDAIAGGQMAAIGGAMNDVGKSCKGCHDDFMEEH